MKHSLPPPAELLDYKINHIYRNSNTCNFLGSLKQTQYLKTLLGLGVAPCWIMLALKRKPK
jgi:hypothetical protein